MATRSIEAIEHKGKVYVSLGDLQAYLASLAYAADAGTGKQLLTHLLMQLEEIRDQRPV